LLNPEILETRKARESGQIGVKEIERQKLQLDKEILADAQTKRPPTEAAFIQLEFLVSLPLS